MNFFSEDKWICDNTAEGEEGREDFHWKHLFFLFFLFFPPPKTNWWSEDSVPI